MVFPLASLRQAAMTRRSTSGMSLTGAALSPSRDHVRLGLLCRPQGSREHLWKLWTRLGCPSGTPPLGWSGQLLAPGPAAKYIVDAGTNVRSMFFKMVWRRPYLIRRMKNVAYDEIRVCVSRALPVCDAARPAQAPAAAAHAGAAGAHRHRAVRGVGLRQPARRELRHRRGHLPLHLGRPSPGGGRTETRYFSFPLPHPGRQRCQLPAVG